MIYGAVKGTRWVVTAKDLRRAVWLASEEFGLPMEKSRSKTLGFEFATPVTVCGISREDLV